jgi:hypothetical protein
VICAETILEWLKAVGPLLVAIAVLCATWNFQNWQVRLAKQKLRHDLYDRRLAIYVAFRDLLMALPEKSSDEIKDALRKASIACLEAQFVLGDPKIQEYLETLCKKVTDDVVANITFLDARKKQGDPQIDPEFLKRAACLSKADLPPFSQPVITGDSRFRFGFGNTP